VETTPVTAGFGVLELGACSLVFICWETLYTDCCWESMNVVDELSWRLKNLNARCRNALRERRTCKKVKSVCESEKCAMCEEKSLNTQIRVHAKRHTKQSLAQKPSMHVRGKMITTHKWCLIPTVSTLLEEISRDCFLITARQLSRSSKVRRKMYHVLLYLIFRNTKGLVPGDF
jgi:hypothetical protein